MEWKGIPREEIEWNPTVDQTKCIGCGMCFLSCGKKVFDYDKNTKKVTVSRPKECMVGCTSCSVWCVFDAITFPDPKYVKDLIKKRNVLNFIKKQLDQTLNE